MSKPTIHPEKIKIAVIIHAVIILAGITALAAGHFLGTKVLFYSGLFVTLAGVLLEIIYIINQRPE